MARVLFNSCCIEPCKACGECCVECSKCCDNCMKPFEDCCKSCGECCGNFCEYINELFSEPLSCCLTITILVMGLAGVFGGVFVMAKSDECTSPVTVWSVVAIAECCVHVIAAIYVFSQVQHRSKSGESTFGVIYDIFMNDLWMASYILFDFFSIGWSIAGLVWSRDCVKGSEPRLWIFTISIVLLLYVNLSYLTLIWNLFWEAVKEEPCFCMCFCPFMLCPCCFGEVLTQSYDRQREKRPEQQPPAAQGGYNRAPQNPQPPAGNYQQGGAATFVNVNDRPNARRQDQNANNAGATGPSVGRQAAGVAGRAAWWSVSTVGNALWNAASKKPENKIDKDRVGHV